MPLRGGFGALWLRAHSSGGSNHRGQGMKVTRRAVSAGILATGLMPGSAAHAQQRFPGDQPIKVIVGFPAGGSQDNVGRIVAERLSAYWLGAAVVVENVPGAGSNIAFDRVAKGPGRWHADSHRAAAPHHQRVPLPQDHLRPGQGFHPPGTARHLPQPVVRAQQVCPSGPCRS